MFGESDETEALDLIMEVWAKKEGSKYTEIYFKPKDKKYILRTFVD